MKLIVPLPTGQEGLWYKEYLKKFSHERTNVNVKQTFGFPQFHIII